ERGRVHTVHVVDSRQRERDGDGAIRWWSQAALRPQGRRPDEYERPATLALRSHYPLDGLPKLDVVGDIRKRYGVEFLVADLELIVTRVSSLTAKTSCEKREQRTVCPPLHGPPPFALSHEKAIWTATLGASSTVMHVLWPFLHCSVH